jgi:hypothetical protein
MMGLWNIDVFYSMVEKFALPCSALPCLALPCAFSDVVI